MRIVQVRDAIQREAGKTIAIDEIWRHLSEFYDLDILERLVRTVAQPLRALTLALT